MKEAKENTFLPAEQASEILEEIINKYLPESEWQKMKPVLAEMDCLTEGNVKEGE